ncbi:MAG: rRNA maturation RNase YbeY [Omnitrophica WOR_2 bacterium RIFCSPLOWO2_12_FULL_51_24]|nr:MAG: rRNA maturation RNase YbeY [Omnitrophica WOR_2 bacterium RIFCSPHIGHO2_01_FULL_49_10]OGX41820.1 MAG: rRNA maturation RNase YbeY [Omnitrophica WOR_2 bacterium RIFCSPLOWO2_12_FULL_51_24]
MTEGVKLPFSKEKAVRYAEKILSILGNRAGSICILFTDDALIRRLNKRYRKRDKSTDVLAFETGDIIISAETAARNSRGFGSTLADELKLYMIHGILHLSGYDDTTSPKKETMRIMEERVLKRL